MKLSPFANTKEMLDMIFSICTEYVQNMIISLASSRSPRSYNIDCSLYTQKETTTKKFESILLELFDH